MEDIHTERERSTWIDNWRLSSWTGTRETQGRAIYMVDIAFLHNTFRILPLSLHTLERKPDNVTEFLYWTQKSSPSSVLCVCGVVTPRYYWCFPPSLSLALTPMPSTPYIYFFKGVETRIGSEPPMRSSSPVCFLLQEREREVIGPLGVWETGLYGPWLCVPILLDSCGYRKCNSEGE